MAQALVQAERYGTPVAHALRVLASESRDMRMNAAEKKAAALPPKLTVPMILFFLPVLFAIILGPAGIQVSERGIFGDQQRIIEQQLSLAAIARESRGADATRLRVCMPMSIAGTAGSNVRDVVRAQFGRRLCLVLVLELVPGVLLGQHLRR